MRLHTTLPLGALLLAFVACGNEKPPVTTPVTTTTTRNAPAWIDNEEIPDGIGAVGIAQPNPMGDKGLQRTVALADARTKMAGKMKVRVQSMFARLDQSVTTASADGSKKPIKSDVMNRVIQNVTRQIVDQELSGTTTRGTYTDPADGSLYLFLVMTKETMDRALAGVAQAQIKKEIAQGEQSLSTALDKLDAAIAASK